jgi:hypothetical protein
MNCPYCGTSLRPNAKFCNQCGKALAEAASAVPAAMAVQPASAPETMPAPAMPSQSLPIEQQPTVMLNPPPAPVTEGSETPDRSNEGTDISTYPTQLLTNHTATGKSTPPGSTPPVIKQEDTASKESLTATGSPVPQPATSVSAQLPTPASPGEAVTAVLSASASAGETPPPEPDEPLAVGVSIGGAYRVEALLGDEHGERIYRVTSLQPPALCWSCGSIQERNAADRFCEDCGADLIGHEYRLREVRLAADEPGVSANMATLSDATSFVVGKYRYRIEAPIPETPFFPNGVRLDVAGLSDVGRERMGSPNEDSILILYLDRVHESISQPLGLFIVADGMGGHASGQEASKLATSVIAEHMLREVFYPAIAGSGNADKDEPSRNRAYYDDNAFATALKAAISQANVALTTVNTREQSDMGCTVTAVAIHGNTAHIANVGDSRTYLLTATELRQLTTDHSVA